MDVELEITFYLPLPTTPPVFPGFHDSGLFPIDWHLPSFTAWQSKFKSIWFLRMWETTCLCAWFCKHKPLHHTKENNSDSPSHFNSSYQHATCLLLNRKWSVIGRNSWHHERISHESLIRKLPSALQLVTVKHFPLNKSPLQSSLGWSTGSERQSPYIIREDMTWYDTHQDTITHTCENATHNVS